MAERKIFLIGLMGSGKTTLGRKLAQALGLPFHDTDLLIEARAGMPVAGLFATAGEPTFRALEKGVLQELINQTSPAVIATGGGLPCQPGHTDLMHTAGTTLFLDVPPAELARRLAPKLPFRPLLAGQTIETLPLFLANMREARLPYYSQAKITLSGEALTVHDLLAALGPG